jgi:CBS domain-containing protein
MRKVVTMEVREVMTNDVQTCRSVDSVHRAAQIMWEHDCGCVPVVEDDGAIVAVITDRDICMAAYTQGRSLLDVAVGSAASRNLVTVRDNDSLQQAAQLMHDAQVRRLPVIGADGRLVGILSLGDLARSMRVAGAAELVSTLAGVSQRPSVDGQPDGADPSLVSSDPRQDVKRGLTLLQTLRDEVRLKLHLGSVEFKEHWSKLETHLSEVEKRAEVMVETRFDEVERKTEVLTDASRAAVVQAIKRVENFLSSLTGHR